MVPTKVIETSCTFIVSTVDLPIFAMTAAAISAPEKDKDVPSAVDASKDSVNAVVAPRNQKRTPFSKSANRLTLRRSAGVEAGLVGVTIAETSAGSNLAATVGWSPAEMIEVLSG